MFLKLKTKGKYYGTVKFLETKILKASKIKQKSQNKNKEHHQLNPYFLWTLF